MGQICGDFAVYHWDFDFIDDECNVVGGNGLCRNRTYCQCETCCQQRHHETATGEERWMGAIHSLHYRAVGVAQNAKRAAMIATLLCLTPVNYLAAPASFFSNAFLHSH